MQQAPEEFRFAAVAVDIPVFAVFADQLHVLVDPVDRPPHYVDVIGFIGGMVTTKETTDDTVTRILKEKAGLSQVYTEQLYTFSALERDKRNRVVAVAHIGLIRPDQAATYDHPTARFRPVKDLTGLAYDHDEILLLARKRLQGKLSYTTIAQYLLPKHFTLSALQNIYEIIQNREYDKRNFRKKILSLDILRETGTVEEGVTHRPAALYEFVSDQVLELPLIT